MKHGLNADGAQRVSASLRKFGFEPNGLVAAAMEQLGRK
jgi:hypothetical protein